MTTHTNFFRIGVLTLLLFWSVLALCQMNTFNGNGTSWHDPANWDLNVVPNIFHNVIIPEPFTVIDDIGGSARTITIEKGATLEIKSNPNQNSFTVFGNNQEDNGIFNQGVIRIVDGASLLIQDFIKTGIINEGSITVFQDGKLKFISTPNLLIMEDKALFNHPNAIFLNSGVTEFFNARIKGDAIFNQGNFKNDTNGNIEFNKIDGCAIRNDTTGTFENKGLVTIKELEKSDSISAILNHGTMENKSTGIISFEGTQRDCIENTSTGSFTNKNIIDFKNGSISPNEGEEEITGVGIINKNTFINEKSITAYLHSFDDDTFTFVGLIKNFKDFTNKGTLDIKDVIERVLTNEPNSNFTNEGEVVLDASIPFNNLIFLNKGVLINKSTGKFDLKKLGKIINEGEFLNEINGIIIGHFVDDSLSVNKGIMNLASLLQLGDGEFENLSTGTITFSEDDGFTINGTLTNRGNIEITEPDISNFLEGLFQNTTNAIFEGPGNACTEIITAKFGQVVNEGTITKTIFSTGFLGAPPLHVKLINLPSGKITFDCPNEGLDLKDDNCNNSGLIEFGSAATVARAIKLTSGSTFNNQPLGVITFKAISSDHLIEIEEATGSNVESIFNNEGIIQTDFTGNHNHTIENGILNNGEFNNLGSASIILHGKGFIKNGILNKGVTNPAANAKFHNHGDIEIGHTNHEIKETGIFNQEAANFIHFGGNLKIDNSKQNCLFNNTGCEFKLEDGELTLANTKAPQFAAIRNKGIFKSTQNNVKINIENSDGVGIINSPSSQFINFGSIRFGMNGGTIQSSAIQNFSDFSNENDSEIKIISAGANNQPSFLNSDGAKFTHKGLLEINAANSSSLKNIGDFTTYPCSLTKFSNFLSNEANATFTNAGFIECLSQIPNVDNGTFTNNAIIEDHFNSFISTNITNNGIIVSTYETNDETTPLDNTLQMGSVVGNFNIDPTWKNISTGADEDYIAATNTLDIVLPLSIGNTEFQFDIEDNAESCAQTMSLFVETSDAFNCTIESLQATNNEDNGSANAITDGGTPPFTFEWEGPNGFTANTQTIQGLAPGDYSVTVTDDEFLESICNVTIGSFTATITSFTHATNNQNNGSITVERTNFGLFNQSDEWTGPNGFTSNSLTINNLAPGLYTFKATLTTGEVASAMVCIENILPPPSCAINIIWMGGLTGFDQDGEPIIEGDGVSWDDPKNWDQQRVPLPNDRVRIDPAFLHESVENNTTVNIPDGTVLERFVTGDGITNEVLGTFEVNCQLFVRSNFNIPANSKLIGTDVLKFHIVYPTVQDFTLDGTIEVSGTGVNTPTLIIDVDNIKINGSIIADHIEKGSENIVEFIGHTTVNPGGKIDVQFGDIGISGLNVNKGEIIVSNCNVGLNNLTENAGTITLDQCDTGIESLEFNKAGGSIEAKTCGTSIKAANIGLVNDGNILIGDKSSLGNACTLGIDGPVTNEGAITMDNVITGIELAAGEKLENHGTLKIGTDDNLFLKKAIAGLNGIFESTSDFEIRGFKTSGVEPPYENPANKTIIISGSGFGTGFKNLIKNEGIIKASKCGTGMFLFGPNTGTIEVDDCGTGIRGGGINEGTIKGNNCFKAISDGVMNHGQIEIGFIEKCTIGIEGLVENLGDLDILRAETAVGGSIINHTTVNIGIEGNPQTEIGTGITGIITNHGFINIMGFDQRGTGSGGHNLQGGIMKLHGKVNNSNAPLPEMGMRIKDNEFLNEGTIEIKNIRNIGIHVFRDITNANIDFHNKGLITINSVGVNVNSPGAQGIALVEHAKFINDGEVFIGSEDASGATGGTIKGVGILLHIPRPTFAPNPIFRNNSLVKIDRVQDGGSPVFETGHGFLVFLESSSAPVHTVVFENNGDLHIGKHGGIEKDGIKFQKIQATGLSFTAPATFLNKAKITIDQTGRHGFNFDLDNHHAFGFNEGTIEIGSNHPIGGNGMKFLNAIFENKPGAEISINDASGNGVEIQAKITDNIIGNQFVPASFKNEGILKIGNDATKTIGGTGMLAHLTGTTHDDTELSIFNLSNVPLSIDNCLQGGINFEDVALPGKLIFNNNGIIDIGFNTDPDAPIIGDGIRFESIEFDNQIVNNLFPSIFVEDCTGHGLNIRNTDFENVGLVEIFNVDGNGLNVENFAALFENKNSLLIEKTGGHGIFMDDANFEHYANATLRIDDIGKDGIHLTGDNQNFFNAHEDISIGINFSAKGNGITLLNDVKFNNHKSITIEADMTGLHCEGSLTNKEDSQITIEKSDIGIHNRKSLINEANSTIDIKDFETTGIINEGGFGTNKLLNKGFIFAHTFQPTGNDLSLDNKAGAEFENAACGAVNLFGQFNNIDPSEISNAGFFNLESVDNPISFAFDGAFFNDGAIGDVQKKIDLENSLLLINNELILRACCSGNTVNGEVDMPVKLGGENNMQPASVWTSNTLGNGDFDFSNNKVVFPSFLPVNIGMYEVGMEVKDNANGCTQQMKETILFENLLISSQMPICEDENITFAATLIGEPNYEFFKDNNNNNEIDAGESLQSGNSEDFITNTLNNGDLIKVAITLLDQSMVISNGIIAVKENDVDGDGFCVSNGDCDDNDPNINPDANEICDGLDNDCDGNIPVDELDNDGDGFIACEDCDDNNPDFFPGAAEFCDGLDNDCDGNIPADEIDNDGDGFLACEDCDDNDANTFPGANELCDGLDNDCDGIIPNDESDADSDGVSFCEGDCDDSDPTSFPGAPELCDGIDNNCDGLIDENGVCNDADNDGVTVNQGDCDDNDATVYPGAPELCDGKDNDCDGNIPANEVDVDGDGSFACADCDDFDPTIFPSAPELCDGLDNDCDGIVPANEVDNDGDGSMACEDCNDNDPEIFPGNFEFICDGIDNDCDPLTLDHPLDGDGDGFTVCQGDCDDFNANIFPGNPEIHCDGLNNDCDNTTPDLVDLDGDGFSSCGGVDCDDNNPSVYLNAPEICDGLDNDCDGQIDEGGVCGDADGDGFSISNGDCDDTDPFIHPNAPEICDGIDNNCDGQIDEGITSATHVGNVTFVTQAQVNNFLTCYTIIDGDMSVVNSSVNDLSNLSSLEEVTGNVVIKQSSLEDLSGLDNLAKIGGRLDITSNTKLEELVGLESLTEIGDNLFIFGNSQELESLDGLENLVDVGGDLVMFFNSVLSDCCAIEPILPTGITGTIAIAANTNGCQSIADIQQTCQTSPFIGTPSTVVEGNSFANSDKIRALIYPNPAKEFLNIEIHNQYENGIITIFNNLGQQIHSERIEAINKLEIGVEDIPGGLYFLNIRLDDKSISQKLFIE